jgi:hypothetical protein
MNPHPGRRERSCWTLKTGQLRLEITWKEAFLTCWQRLCALPAPT